MEKCWPFDGNVEELKQETVEEFLPPITIKKFKWWSDEFEKWEKEVSSVLVSGEEEEEKKKRKVVNCPVCLIFKSSSINTMATHVNACLTRATRRERKKVKQPKKRSIVEIFADAPQVGEGEGEGEGEEEECDSDDQENMSVMDILENVKKKKKTKREERLAGIMKKLKKASRKIMKKKSIGTKKQENIYRSKSSIQSSLARKLKSSFSEKKLISKTQSSRKPNKLKNIQVSKYSKQYQKPTRNLVHGILKKCSSISEETSVEGNTSSGDQTKHCQQVGNHVQLKHCQQVGKHVQFSNQDCILGDSSSVDHLQVHNSCDVLSDSMVLSSLNSQLETEDNVSPASDEIVDLNGSTKDIVASVTCGSDIQSVEENEGSNDINANIVQPSFWSSNNRINHDRAQGLSNDLERLARDLQHQGNLNRFGKSQSPYDSSYISFQSGTRNLLDICAVPNQKSAAMASTMNTPLEALNSSLAKTREADTRGPFLSQDQSRNQNSWELQCHPFLQLTPKDVGTSTSSLVDQKKKKTAVYGNKFVDDDFIGLPLNSHGELIKLHSSGKGGLNQLKKQNMMNAVSNFSGRNFVLPESNLDHSEKDKRYSGERGLPKEKSKWIPEHNYLKSADTSSRTGITELQGTGRREVKGKSQYVHQLGLDLNHMNITSSECCQYAENHNQSGKEKIIGLEYSDLGFLPTTQPTMRLMGKDVTVGSVKGAEDGKVWTDKNVIKENPPTVVPENSSLRRTFQLDATINGSSGKSKETRSRLGSQGIPTRPYFPSMRAADSKSSQTYNSWQANIMPQGGSHFTKQRQSVQMHPFSYSLPSEELTRGSLRTPETSVYGAESRNLSSQIKSASQHPCQCMRFNSSQFPHNQGLAHCSSSFQYPFASQVCEKCVEPSQPRSSSKDLPHWMLDVSQKKESPFCSSGYGTSLKNHPYNSSGSNFSSMPASYSTSMISQSSRSLHPTKNSSGTYLVQRPLIPVPPGFRPNYSMSTSYRHRIDLKNKMKPHIFHGKDVDHSNRIKKRPADRTDSSTMYLKKAYLEMPMQSSDMMGMGKGVRLNGSSALDSEAPEIDLNRENGRDDVEHSVEEVNLSGCSIHDIRAPELDGNRCSTNVGDGQHPQTEIDKDGFRALDMVISSNTDTVARSGPIKLSAGVKHILKPSPNTDQDNSRPIHSTIPYGSVNTSGKDSELHTKPSKVYRL